MQNAKGVNTPMTSRHKVTVYVSEPVKDVQLYRSLVGPFSTVTLPDQKSLLVLIDVLIHASSFGNT